MCREDEEERIRNAGGFIVHKVGAVAYKQCEQFIIHQRSCTTSPNFYQTAMTGGSLCLTRDAALERVVLTFQRVMGNLAVSRAFGDAEFKRNINYGGGGNNNANNAQVPTMYV